MTAEGLAMAQDPKKQTPVGRFALGLMVVVAMPAAADSGPLQDPTGCATGSAVANCRELPALGGSRDSDAQRQRPSRSQGLSTGDRLRQQSPLPSEGLRDRTSPPPPPGSTGLDGGSTGLGD